MHNIKSIRKDPDYYLRKFTNRNTDINLKNLLNLDKKNRELIQSKEKLEQEKKMISKKQDESQFSRSKEISKEIEQLSKSQMKIKNEIEATLSSLPNIALDDVPIGKDETCNKELKKVGEITEFKFKPLSHYDIGKKLDLMDFDIARKTSGARFVFLKDKLALLERAISNFMLDCHTKEFDYQEISPPLIVNEDVMYGTGQLPKFESDQFEIKLDDEKFKKFLIPTAEVVLTNIARESFVDKNKLPLRLVASTACFRKEAGSYGKDTKGMTREGVRNIEGYNNNNKTVMPYIVVIVDEMSDLMLVAGKEIENYVQKLSQMARAAGIHIIMATQRPSVDVITGTIKANFPTRISFQVSSKIDSRTILGEQGAEQLLGKGDMLFMSSANRIMRIHSPYVSENEIEKINSFLRSQEEPDYVHEIMGFTDEKNFDQSFAESEKKDQLYKNAIELVKSEGKASTSFLQRKLQIGYNRAARIIDMMEDEGIVSKPNHVGKREIL